MKRIHIINGPNLNLLGKREPEIYGAEGFETYLLQLIQEFPDVKIDYFQSNVEGELINAIQSAGINADGVILNPAGYTHTSVAIGDAIAAIKIPVVEVHLSNVFAREKFRHHSYFTDLAVGIVSGLGGKGYELALDYALQHSQGV